MGTSTDVRIVSFHAAQARDSVNKMEKNFPSLIGAISRVSAKFPYREPASLSCVMASADMKMIIQQEFHDFYRSAWPGCRRNIMTAELPLFVAER